MIVRCLTVSLLVFGPGVRAAQLAPTPQDPARSAPAALSFEDVLAGRARFSIRPPAAKWVGEGNLRFWPQGRSSKRKAEVRNARTWDLVPGPASPAVGKPEPSMQPDRQTGPARSMVAIEDGVRVVLRERGAQTPDAKPRILFESEVPKREAHLSPVCSAVSFVEQNNLVVVDVESGERWQVTQDGGDEMFHGVLDWVYQEEIYGRYDFQGHWWSPDGKHVAFLSLDESPVREFTVIDHSPTRDLAQERSVVAEVSNYPKAGDPNPVVSLSIASLEDRSVVRVDLSRYPDDQLLVQVGWTPDSANVVYQVQDRVQSWLELGFADVQTGKSRAVIREISDTWVNVLGAPRWLDDGSFLWWSERNGKKGLFQYAADGELIARITPEAFVARDILRLDEAGGLLWFRGSDEYPSDTHAFRVDFAGQVCIRLTQGRGSHAVTFNDDGSMFLDVVSAVDTLPEIRVCEGKDGTVLHRFEAPEPSWKFAACPTELHTVIARDGFSLEATVTKPLGFDQNGGPYPVWIRQYSGPESPSVRNRYGVSGWDQFLAHQGIIVLRLNVRTASLAGRDIVGLCHKQFGVQELKDLEDVVRWLTNNAWADAGRVGITGWSYGGTMTAYAMTHSKLFRVGIAGAGVYDWQLYDTIYTERYMDLPQENIEGYRKSSCLAAAKDLHGYLVLLHGTMDDNVHLQNTIRFAGELQRAGKDFEMMLYPNSRHGVREPGLAGHLRRLRWKIIRRELLGTGQG